jgi:hypothetical protein
VRYGFVQVKCLPAKLGDGMPWGSLGSLIERVRTGSVLAPLLALTLIVGVAAFSITFSADLILVRALWLLFAFCVLATLLAYVVFAVKDPEKLQTEDYRLARHRLDLIGDERDPNDARLIEATPTANTHLETAS